MKDFCKTLARINLRLVYCYHCYHNICIGTESGHLVLIIDGP